MRIRPTALIRRFAGVIVGTADLAPAAHATLSECPIAVIATGRIERRVAAIIVCNTDIFATTDRIAADRATYTIRTRSRAFLAALFPIEPFRRTTLAIDGNGIVVATDLAGPGF